MSFKMSGGRAPSSITHAELAGLSADDHTQYAWGRAVYLDRSDPTKDGATDDAAAIQAAITAATSSSNVTYHATAGGALVVLGKGLIGFTGLIDVPPFTDIRGEGMGLTVFVALDAAAQIRFGERTVDNRGGRSGDFTIDGNGVATAPLYIGLSVERRFHDIQVYDAAGVGITIEASQNCRFVNVNSQDNGTSNVVFDYGAGNNVFLGCEFSKPGMDAAGYNVAFVRSGASPSGAFSVPTNNRFIGCVIERAGVNAARSVYHGAGRGNTFDKCNLSATGLSASFSMVIMRRDGSGSCSHLRFIDCTFDGTTGQTTVFDLANDATNGTVGPLVLSGYTFCENHAYLYAVDEVSGAIPTVIEGRMNSFTASGGASVVARFVNRTGGGTKTETDLHTTSDFDAKRLRSVSVTSGAVVEQLAIAGEAHARWQRLASGTQYFGSGSASLDTTFARDAAGSMSISGSKIQTAAMKGVASGICDLDASALVPAARLPAAAAGAIGAVLKAAFVADPAGGATVDTEARAAIVAILNALIAAGQMSSS